MSKKCRRRCVDALLEYAQVGAESFDLVSNVGEVTQGPAEAIKSGHHQAVALHQHL